MPLLHSIMLTNSSDVNTAHQASAGSAAAAAAAALPLAQQFEDTQALDLEASLGLRTGEDAIAFFAQHGNSTSVKFLYCNRRDQMEAARLQDAAETEKAALVYRPYDLVVVSGKEVLPEYYTVSASGVVRVVPNEPSEFQSLAEWMHQAASFNILRSIGFFKHYLVTKTFRMWRSNVRHSLYCQQRKRLADSLFLARPSFCAPLLDAARLMHDMRQVQLLNTKAQSHSGGQPHVYQHDVFAQDQAEQCSSASKRFQEQGEKLESLLDAVCRDVKERLRSSEAEVAEHKGSSSAMGAGWHLVGEGTRAKSMVQQRLERAERLRRLRHAEQEAQRLGQFVRLVDYMQVESLVTVCTGAAAEFLRLLRLVAHRERERERPLIFKSVLQFGPDGLEFNPTAALICKLVNSMVEQHISTVATVDRVLFLKHLKPFVVGGGSGGNAPNTRAPLLEAPQVDVIARQSEPFRRTRAAIEAKVEEDFRAALQAVSALEQFRPVYTFGQQWNLEEYRAGEHSVASLQADMAQQEDWSSEIERGVRYTYEAGIFQVR